MNRREMVILPGIALAATRGFSQTQSTAASPSTGSATLSHKAIARYSRLKSFSTIPKSAAQQAKYVNFLTTLLSLTQTQQTQTASIFSNASASHATVKRSMKTARQSLAEAVKNNDGEGISRASGAIGKYEGDRHSIGARANAALYQILAADQQAKLSQFKS
jgi:hypothetical protein